MHDYNYTNDTRTRLQLVVTRQEREFGRLWIITLATVGATTPILLLHSL
jgi:hypothetical protein